MGRAEDRPRDADRRTDHDRAEHDAEAAGEILQAGGSTFAPLRCEREREGLRQRQHDRTRECHDRKPDQQRCERVGHDADQKPGAVDEAREPHGPYEADPVGQPAGERRPCDVGDGDDGDHGGGDCR